MSRSTRRGGLRRGRASRALASSTHRPLRNGTKQTIIYASTTTSRFCEHQPCLSCCRISSFDELVAPMPGPREPRARNNSDIKAPSPLVDLLLATVTHAPPQLYTTLVEGCLSRHVGPSGERACHGGRHAVEGLKLTTWMGRCFLKVLSVSLGWGLRWWAGGCCRRSSLHLEGAARLDASVSLVCSQTFALRHGPADMCSSGLGTYPFVV